MTSSKRLKVGIGKLSENWTVEAWIEEKGWGSDGVKVLKKLKSQYENKF